MPVVVGARTVGVCFFLLFLKIGETTMGRLDVVCCISLVLLRLDLGDLASLHPGSDLSTHQDNSQRLHHGTHHHRHPARQTEGCAANEFLRTLEDGEKRCTACSSCPAGFGVKQRCGQTWDTVCERCLPGQGYLREYFGVSKCFSCKSCENRIVVKECTPTSNRVCGDCKPGYFYEDMTATCIRCAYCYPEIPNYGVVEPMCQTEHQPPEMTCLPSLPPFSTSREQTPGLPHAVPNSIRVAYESKIQALEEKVQRLSATVSEELGEVRNDLRKLKRVLQTA